MEGMTLNYVLLTITGVWTLINFVGAKKEQGYTHQLGSILSPILFVLVLIATIKGIDYTTLKFMIEGY